VGGIGVAVTDGVTIIGVKVAVGGTAKTGVVGFEPQAVNTKAIATIKYKCKENNFLKFGIGRIM